MANVKDKKPENVSGRFYVDSGCIDCDLCRGMAPGSFLRDAATDQSFVARQPIEQGEIDLCMDAVAACPVEAIGFDGE